MTGIDERILAGMRDQLAVRDERLRTGERQVGWKVGFGSAASMAQLGIDRPLAGFLMESAVLPDGASVPVGSWTAPLFEPEIAVHLAGDVAPGASADEVRASVAGLSAAIELADLDPPPTDVREVLAGNIFQRHVVLGPVDASRTDGAGIRGRLLVDGAEVAACDDPESVVGPLLEVVRLTAELLDAVGETLRAGSVLITGAFVPPARVAAGQTAVVSLDPLGDLGVRFTA